MRTLFIEFEISQTLICTYGRMGILLHKAIYKEGMPHNGICVAEEKHIKICLKFCPSVHDMHNDLLLTKIRALHRHSELKKTTKKPKLMNQQLNTDVTI